MWNALEQYVKRNALYLGHNDAGMFDFNLCTFRPVNDWYYPAMLTLLLICSTNNIPF